MICGAKVRPKVVNPEKIYAYLACMVAFDAFRKFLGQN